MPARTLIDVPHRVVFGVGEGRLTFLEIVKQRVLLQTNPLFAADFRQVLFFDDVTDLQLFAQEVRLLAADDIFSATSRRAFVASVDAVARLAHLFAAYRASGGPNIRVVETLVDAARWVELDFVTVSRAIHGLRHNR